MKQLIKPILTFLAFFTISCSTAQPLTSSDENNNTKGYLQKHLDAWINDDWEPTVKESETNGSKRFKLQDYVDKAALYMKAHPSDENNSNVKKMEALPVIGKQR